MKFENIKNLKSEEFHRLMGIKFESFKKMEEIIDKAFKEQKSKEGRPNKLCVADMLLMTLEYVREYRTPFHICTNGRMSESHCYDTIHFY